MKRILKKALALMVLTTSFLPLKLKAQTFATTPQNVLTENFTAPMEVHLADLDEDGDLDIIYSYPSGNFVWKKNLDGLGNYGPSLPVSNVGYYFREIQSGDIDLDGDLDLIVVNAAGQENVSWIENLDCTDNFNGPQIIENHPALEIVHCYPADLDGDGDLDIATHTYSFTNGYNVVWYKNTDGQGNFSSAITIEHFPNIGNGNAMGDIKAADLDGDGDMDILLESRLTNEINWHENLDGQGNFGPSQSIATSIGGLGANSLSAVDLDGDGDKDVLLGTLTDRIVWYENTDGQGTFGTEQVIYSTQGNDLNEVHSEDVDGDGDMDIIAVFNFSISWFENIDCAGGFSSQQFIQPFMTGINTGGSSLSIGDIDGDADIDLLIGDSSRVRINWYENIIPSSVMYLPEEIYICDNNFEELCGPLSSTCNTYNYSWYFNDPTTNTPNLVSTNQCYTPDQYGNYTLTAQTSDGSVTNYTIEVKEKLPQPVLASSNQICSGDVLNIEGQGFDNCNYEIIWYHDNNQVQQGGVVLNSTYSSGTVTVKVTYDGCTVSASVDIVSTSQAAAHLISTTGTENITTIPYGSMEIPVVGCNVLLDGSASMCEDAYFMSIAKFNYSSWSNIGNPLYTGWTQGQAPSSIDLEQYVNFQVGSYYMVQFAVGPNWDAEYILFKYEGSQAAASLQNVNTYQLVNTPYGPKKVPELCGEVVLDGSASTCEDAYYMSITPFDPLTWSGGNPIYQGWTQGQAPNNIDLTQAPFNLSFTNGSYYMIQFAVGPNWDAEYILFKYYCEIKEEIAISPNPTRGEFKVSVKGNKEKGVLNVLDITGKVIYKGNIVNEEKTSVDISRRPLGIYLVKVILKEKVLNGKVVKE